MATYKEENARNFKSGPSLANDDVRDTAEAAGRKVRALFDNASEELARAGDTLAEQIKNKPLQSSLIAVGIGFVIGSLLSRK